MVSSNHFSVLPRILETQYLINSQVFNARIIGAMHLTRVVRTMARFASAVVPGCPYHKTQRGNRRQQEFFRDSDYSEYLGLFSLLFF
jgi:hypothetical protein